MEFQQNHILQIHYANTQHTTPNTIYANKRPPNTLCNFTSLQIHYANTHPSKYNMQIHIPPNTLYKYTPLKIQYANTHPQNKLCKYTSLPNILYKYASLKIYCLSTRQRKYPKQDIIEISATNLKFPLFSEGHFVVKTYTFQGGFRVS